MGAVVDVPRNQRGVYQPEGRGGVPLLTCWALREEHALRGTGGFERTEVVMPGAARVGSFLGVGNSGVVA